MNISDYIPKHKEVCVGVEAPLIPIMIKSFNITIKDEKEYDDIMSHLIDIGFRVMYTNEKFTSKKEVRNIIAYIEECDNKIYLDLRTGESYSCYDLIEIIDTTLYLRKLKLKSLT